MAKKKKKQGVTLMIAVGVPKSKPKMMYGGMAQGKKHMYTTGGDVKDNLRPIPPGNKGLPKLPEPVRNRLGFKNKGGLV